MEVKEFIEITDEGEDIRVKGQFVLSAKQEDLILAREDE